MRRRLTIALVVLPLALLGYWVARNTYWADVPVPVPLRGEARDDPFYAARRFAELLGARTVRERVLVIPRTEDVIVLSDWHWTLTSTRRSELERWVEAGGRLVVTGPLTGGDADFERWSGIGWEERDPDDDPAASEPAPYCRPFREEHAGTPADGVSGREICGVDETSELATSRPAAWIVRDSSGVQMARTVVGKGSVTVLNTNVFRYLFLFEGDHARLFTAATALQRGDEVHFLSEGTHPSLLSLLWQHGRPVVLLCATAIALLLWRGAVRFGPLAASGTPARRSLAEQIRGTGYFAFHEGGGDALHAASVRALEEAAVRRVPGYSTLAPGDRAAALARLTGFDREALAEAMHHAALRSGPALRNTLVFLETARRRALDSEQRTGHGTV